MSIALNDFACRSLGKTSGIASSILAVSFAGFSTLALASNPVPIELQFAGEFSGQPFDCSTQYKDIGSTAATVNVSDFRLYVSRVRLLDASGKQTPVTLQDNGPWQHGDVALLDFENASGACSNGTVETNSIVKIMAPPADYTGVAFDIGVPFASNHQDPTLAESPLNLTSLFWNWRGGYRFMRVDLQPAMPAMKAEMSAKPEKTKSHQADSASGMQRKHGKGWALHLGSTGCVSSSPTNRPASCTSPNHISVEFPESSPGSSTFVIDPARVLVDSDVTANTDGTSPGCMSAPDDPECEAVFKALGLADDGHPQSLVVVR